jgi:hypothetical protein
MAHIGNGEDNRENVSETPYDARYATAVEVDGLRRTFDSFMKKQDQHNDTMAVNLDKIMSYMTQVAAKVGVPNMEDKGSNVKANELSEGFAPQKPPPRPRVEFQLNKSLHIPEGTDNSQHQHYHPPPVQVVHYYDPEELEWGNKKPIEQWRNPHYSEVEYGWEDCPWTPQEIEAFLQPIPKPTTQIHSPATKPPLPPQQTSNTPLHTTCKHIPSNKLFQVSSSISAQSYS